MRKTMVLGLILLLLLALGVTPALSQSEDAPASSAPAVALPCPGAPTPQLVVGGMGHVAQTYSTLWVNPTSSAFYKRMLSANLDTFTVVNGPFCAGGPYNWYEVQHTDAVLGTLTGWVTEGTGNAYWVLPGDYPAPPPPPVVTPVPDPSPVPPVVTPTGPQLPPRPEAGATSCPGAPPFLLTVNGTGQPAQAYQSLWVNPYSAAVQTVMYASTGDTYTVVDGPFCYRSYNWYLVDFNGTQGFITEGTGNAYWAEPVGTVADPVADAAAADPAADAGAADPAADAAAADPAMTEEPAGTEAGQ